MEHKQLTTLVHTTSSHAFIYKNRDSGVLYRTEYQEPKQLHENPQHIACNSTQSTENSYSNPNRKRKKKSQPFHNDHQFQKEFKIGNHVGSLNRVGSNMYMKKNEPESDIWWLSMPRKSDRRPEICKRVRVWISDFP